MLDPETLLIVGVIGGLGSAGTFAAYNYAAKAGPKLTMKDLLPMPPPYPPVPRFLFTKPELLAELRRR
ncbi:hypothetical protein ES703_124165 [subsurface metagenome]